MSKYFLMILLSFFSISTVASDHNETSIFAKRWTKIAAINTTNIQATFKLVSGLGIDIAGVNYKKNQVDVLLTDYDYTVLEAQGFDFTIKETKGVSLSTDDSYKNPKEIETLLKTASVNYPHLTKLEVIGQSLEGRDIYALKISDNAETFEKREPAILFNSMHHAREVMTPEISISIINYLLQNYETNSSVKKWVNENEIWIIPMFNVDGNNKMWNEDKWWRKNTRGGYGVDLNRNYPAGWKKCRGSSGFKWSQTYRGPSPASEPETQAMMKFIERVRPVFDISYHSYSELVIYPFGCKGERASTADVVEKIGKEIASRLNYKPGTAWELLYNADGGDIDWMYDAFQVIPYVIEVNSSDEGFQPNYKDWRNKTVKRNLPGWQYLLERVSQSGIRGELRDNKGTISKFRLKVFKTSDLKNIYQTYVGHHTGMFHLVLNPGTYKISVEIEGEIVKTISKIVTSKLESFDIEL